MYLKKIEVQGFKSFANKIRFDFHTGITGIVGPNGSGKSNVSDAVRWVLGEQSAKSLRGGNMQDVIFAGTKLRKPQGYAFVAITLDNSDHSLAIDFDEVTVSRRLFRSGESEYMINGSSVRLKDINELFYDTGIGKDGYSIIGQGQVEKILSGKPEERRELFDEAAGITKFKRRKSIAIKKLENEKANLTRVSDILAELEKQVDPLKKQAELAKEYLKLRDELRILDSTMFVLQEEKINLDLEELSKNENIITKDLELANKDSISVNENFDTLDKELSELEKLILSIRDEISNKSLKLQEYHGKIDLLKEQINTDKVNLKHLEDKKLSITSDIDNKKLDLKNEEETKKLLIEKLEESLVIKEDLDLKIKIQNDKIESLVKNISKYNEQKIQSLHTKSDLLAKLESLKSTISQLNIRKSELDSRRLNIEVEYKNIDTRIFEEQEKKAKLEKENEILSKKLEEIETKLAKSNNTENDIIIEIDKYNIIYQKTKAKLDTLKNLAERYEGYGLAIKKVMEAKTKVSGIHGVVADLIKVDKEYELAIEIALGGRIQNIVTDDEETAKQLIEYLKTNKLGRATFLPLSSIEAGLSIKNDTILSENGVIGIASKLLKCEAKYMKLLNNLLSKIIIVDNIDNAIAIAKKYKYEYRLVTLDGEQLSPGGSISGGAYKNNSNLLGRKREIDELEYNFNEAKNRLSILNSNLSKLREELATVKSILDKDKEDLANNKLDLNTLKNSIDILSERKEQNNTDLSLIFSEIEDLNMQIKENSLEYESLAKSIKHLEEANITEDEASKNLGESLRQLRLENEELLAKQKNVELNLGSLNTNIENISNNVIKIKSELEDLIYQAKDFKTNISYEENISEKEALIYDINIKIKEVKRHLEESDKNLKEYLSIKENKSLSHKDLFDKKDEILQRISLLDKEMFRLQANKEKLEEKAANLSNYMWIEYELTLSSAKNFVDESLVNLVELKKDIDKKKADIRSLGNINISAIEEYKAVSERYEELKTQYDDIVLASEQLISIIAELDTGMRKQFKEKFALINNEFNKVFSELFGGGSGRLELESDVDLLDASINIISQPPGKKLQNMMQLSGGEKALTAISLLFAIQNLKPSPFALLDEIEAALDDSNVDRFANYLHKLSDKTQFIVITHRRGTMLNSDRLYGITMQEKGVSTLVSVSLIEDELSS